jgi:cell division protein FtsZ
MGGELNKGLGAGANPQIGPQAAEEDREQIKQVLLGADMVFITAGMGGGTGSGAAPVFAEVAKELGILTVAVVTKPFSFEGKQRALAAEEAIRALGQNVDSLITIPNNKLLSVLGKNISLLNAFKAANNVLLGAVKGISDLITRPGLINVDFADVRTVMSEMGMAMMGTGCASGDQRARRAAEAAIASPLLEDINFSGARGILVNITAAHVKSAGPLPYTCYARQQLNTPYQINFSQQCRHLSDGFHLDLVDRHLNVFYIFVFFGCPDDYFLQFQTFVFQFDIEF